MHTFEEAGGNINKRVDGNICGETLFFERLKTPENQLSTKDKYFTIYRMVLFN